MPFILSDAPSIVRCLVRKEFTQNHTSGQGEVLPRFESLEHLYTAECQIGEPV